MSLLSYLEQDASCITDFRLHQALSAIVPLSSCTPKMGVSRWNGVAILYRSWHISTSGITAAILDFRRPITVFGIAPLNSWSPKMRISRFNGIAVGNVNRFGGRHLEIPTSVYPRRYQQKSVRVFGGGDPVDDTMFSRNSSPALPQPLSRSTSLLPPPTPPSPRRKLGDVAPSRT